MYLPPHFKSEDAGVAAGIMRQNPLASLISNDDDGFPFVTHLPLHLEERDGGFVLHGHCAKPNPHGRYLQARPQALVTFVGPHGYQSPRIYAERERVPSWNYVAVHCRVQARIIEEPQAKDSLLKRLIGDHEPAYAEQWRSLGEEFAHKMMMGITAFELAVLEWQCKLKINQHRPQSLAALREGYLQGNAHEQELAGWMDRLGLKGT